MIWVENIRSSLQAFLLVRNLCAESGYVPRNKERWFSVRSIVFIQHGDFREVYRRFSDGGDETYRDQKKSVNFVAALAPEARVTTIAFGPETYRTELALNLWAVGLRRDSLRTSDIAGVLENAEPSHVILRTPHLGFLREVQRRKIWLLPTFADIFARKGIRTALQNFATRRALLRAKAPCVSNHSLNASRSLVSVLGLPPEKVVPWDWSKVPLASSGKAGVADPARPTAFFAGAMTDDKGVGDCLEAIVELRREGLKLSMNFAGPGDLDHWKTVAEKLGISDQVRFLGMISNAQVRHEMCRHDFVIVPSRHSYAEGLPNTIYEGLASRSVLVISDHPAFVGRLVPEEECLMYPAANPKALARCLSRVSADRKLYQTLSDNAEKAHDALYVGMEWTALVTKFLEDPENRTNWVEPNALSAMA